MKQNPGRRARKKKKKKDLFLSISDQEYLNLCCDFLDLGEDTDISWFKEAPRKSEDQQKLWITHFFLIALKIGTTGKKKKSLLSSNMVKPRDTL